MIFQKKVLTVFTLINLTFFLTGKSSSAQTAADNIWVNEVLLGINNLESVEPVHNLTGAFSFYGIYDRLLDSESHNVNINNSAMSGDGNRLIFSGTDINSGNPVVYLVDADGQNLTSISVPLDFGEVNNVRINQDGTKAFFNNDHLIYKIENGTSTKILDTDDYSEVDRCWGSIKITADGGWVYFREYTDDLWRVAHSGSPPSRIIDDTQVLLDGYPGLHVYEFDVSSDGNTIVFGVNGYLDDGIVRWKHELFAYQGGGIQQLTSDDGNILKSNPTISGDGSTIVYCHWTDNKWYAIKPGGSDKIALEDRGLNIAGADLTNDGTKLFYNDALSNGGRLVNTDGSGCYDLFPWRIGPYCNTGVCISSDGRRVSFTFRYGAPIKEALYIGYLNEEVSNTNAPIIHNIEFDPSAMPTDDPNARVVLSSGISDPQGLSDIIDCTVDELLDGCLIEKRSNNLPALFNFDPHDDGSWPDQTADDGLFCTEGEPGDRIHEFDSVTVRVGVRDLTNKVVVADAILHIGLTDIGVRPGDNLPQAYALYQNYPNPFNPTTTIKFQIPNAAFTTLKVYNILGEEMATLVSERLTAGSYSYEWSRPAGIASGVYLYRLQSGEYVKKRKMLLIR